MEWFRFVIMVDDGRESLFRFYADKSVLLTGSTGFIGKVLLEKLLRCCVDIAVVYVLIRPKRGRSPEERLRQIKNNQIFSRVNEAAFDKVKVIIGDVGKENMGLNETDRKMLLNNVDIVFHSAANVKFNTDIIDTVNVNTIGTARLIELCEDMKRISVFVHVSSAFSNGKQKRIEERVYKPPIDPFKVVNNIGNMSTEGRKLLAKILTENHPNNYTPSKALAEELLQKTSGRFSIVIVRPSIVCSAWKEPHPGWLDNWNGSIGLQMGVATGLLRALHADKNTILDLIPVDVTINCIMAATWYGQEVPQRPFVVNCTSGQINPVTIGHLKDLMIKHGKDKPPKRVIRPPGVWITKNFLLYSLLELLRNVIPAILLDAVLRMFGKGPKVLKACRNIRKATEAFNFFLHNNFDFVNDNLRALQEAVDGQWEGKFPVHLGPGSGFCWDDYISVSNMGIRRYGLKDEDETLPFAKRKLKKLEVLWKAASFAVFAFGSYVVWGVATSFFYQQTYYLAP